MDDVKQSRFTLDDLYRVKVTKKLGDEELTFRALSDFDVQARDEYSMWAQFQKKQELDNPESRAHQLYIIGLDKSTNEELLAIILLAKQYEFRRDATREIKPRFYPQPEDATEEEKLQVLKDREDDRVRVIKEQSEYVLASIAKVKESHQNLTREDLLRITRELQYNEISRGVHIRSFQDYTVWASCFRDEDCKQHRFVSPEEVSKLTTDARNIFLSTYFSEVDRVTPLDLQYGFSMGGSTPSSPQSSSPEPTQAIRGEKGHGKRRGGGQPPITTTNT